MENTDDMMQNMPASSSSDNDPVHYEFAGLWRRSFAFIFDSLLLGFAGIFIIGLFFDQLSAIGEWVRMVGFLIGVLYFGLMEGISGRAQSPGKWMMKIRVVKCTGNGFVPLGFFRAIVRYAIIAIPLVLNGIEFIDVPALRTMDIVMKVNSFVVDLWCIVTVSVSF